MTINTGVGRSLNKDSLKAGKDAAKEAIKELGKSKADVLIIFAAPRFNLQKLLKGITSITKDTPMIGGTTAGEISTKSTSNNSVVIMALQSKSVKFSTGLGTNISKDEAKAGQQVAKDALKGIKKSEARSLIIVPDGLAGDGSKIIKGAQGVLGEYFEIVGGALGDEANFKKTYQFYDGKVYEDAVPGLMISGKNVVTSTGVYSGWTSIGNRMKVTKSKVNVIYEFNGKPALDVYEEYLGKERAKKLPGIGLEYPIGMVDEKAMIGGKEMYFQLRSPLAVDKKAKTITFAAAIPEGKNVTITVASRENVISGSNTSAKLAKNILGKAKPSFMLIFDCIGRKLVLGRRIQEEVDAVQDVLGKEIPMTGFFTYGEIGPIDKRVKKLKSTRWHNQTTVIFVVGEKSG